MNIQFVKGRSYAIVGESGCGKSTLAKLIAGLLPYEQGEINYDDLRVKKIALDEYRTMVRYISQETHLFNTGVKNNVEMGHEAGNYKDFLMALGMDEILARSDVEFEESKDLLSAGQQQRIVLARSLNYLPQVLILDEPTANMDIETAIQSLSIFNKLDDLTLIVITHADNNNLLELFDEVIYMEKSR